MKKIFRRCCSGILLFVTLNMFSSVAFADNLDNGDTDSKEISNRIVCYDVATDTETYYNLDEFQTRPNEIFGCEAQEATEILEDKYLSDEELIAIKEADKNTIEIPNKSFANSSISLNKNSLSLELGGKYKLILKNAEKRSIKWKSSNKRIVSVKNGLIWGKKPGKCSITAKYNGKIYKCKVCVIKPDIRLTIRSFDNYNQEISLNLKNKSKKTTLPFNRQFSLKTFADNKWSNVKFLPNVAFNDIAMLIKPSEEIDINIKFSDYFNILHKGKYRIVYDFGSHGKVYADFVRV